jgi:hypothetical protein
VVAGRFFAFAETASPEPSLSKDIGQENLMLPSGSFSSTPTTTRADPPRKAAARKYFKGAGGARNGSSRAKVIKSEEDGDDADEGDAVYPRFVSSVKNLETRRKRKLSAANLAKPRFKSPRIIDSGLFRKEIKRVFHSAAFGGVNKHHGCGYIAPTAAASGEHAEKNNHSCRRQK